MTKAQDIIPSDLVEILESMEFENDGYISITGLDYFDDELNVQLTIYPGDNLPRQLWEIEINGLKKEHLDISECSDINFSTESNLLYQFTDRTTSLYFNGKAPDPHKLLADIYQCHRLNFSYWLDIEEFLNTNSQDPTSLNNLCKSSFGLFASGPKKYLDKYFKVLLDHQMNPHYQSDYDPIYKDFDKPLGILFIGNSYFIGQNFSLIRG